MEIEEANAEPTQPVLEHSTSRKQSIMTTDKADNQTRVRRIRNCRKQRKKEKTRKRREQKKKRYDQERDEKGTKIANIINELPGEKQVRIEVKKKKGIDGRAPPGVEPAA